MAAKVLIGIPSYDGRIHHSTHTAIAHAVRPPTQTQVVFSQMSILTKCFNNLWIVMLNNRKDYTHFAMLHADIRPEALWLDKMMGIMADHKADVLSAVVPIKSEHGLTSTAIDTDPWNPRRYTMKEMHEMEEGTFTRDGLLVNTGLMLVDISGDWVEKMHFRFNDAIEKNERGLWEAKTAPEDWNFSRDARDLGRSIFVTKSIRLDHLGAQPFPNQGVWGTKASDN